MDAVFNEIVSVSVILAILNENYGVWLATAIEACDEERLTIGNVRGKLIEEWDKQTISNVMIDNRWDVQANFSKNKVI